MSDFLLQYPQIVQAITPIRCFGNPNMHATSVSTDTRTLQPNALFIALKGESFDGHAFVARALEAGAAGAVVSHSGEVNAWLTASPKCTVFLVHDTLKALGDLAAFWRATVAPDVVGITGSNGKTTTKEMAAGIFATQIPTLKTDGNFNNLIGLPLTLLRLRDERAAIIEMGMSERGEIRRLAAIAQPHIGLITNVHAAHLETLGSEAAVAEAKGELFEQLSVDDWAIVNLDNPFTKELGKKTVARRLSFSLQDTHADIYPVASRLDSNGSEATVHVVDTDIHFHLPLPGQHNLMNALAAIAIAQAYSLPPEAMVEGLSQVQVPGARLKLRRDIPELLLIDDAYNANPASMTAAFSVLADLAPDKRRVACLGDMLELGEASADYHFEVGKKAAQSGVKLLLAFGPLSGRMADGALAGGLDIQHVSATQDWNEYENRLLEGIRPGDAVLVKGSRSMHMERAVDVLARRTKEND